MFLAFFPLPSAYCFLPSVLPLPTCLNFSYCLPFPSDDVHSQQQSHHYPVVSWSNPHVGPGVRIASYVRKQFQSISEATMFKITLSLALAILLFTYSGVTPAYAASREEKQSHFTEKLRTGIARLGTGEQARVRIKLLDKTQLEGYVSEATEQDFVVVESKTGVATRVTYAQVKQVKGNNLSTGAKIAIGLGVLAAVLALLLFMENYG
jgi:hypothetical protein